MTFDKVKTLQVAEKYLELGKIPAAIKEYCAIVEHDPDDFTTLNMVGDLYVRVDNRAAAISCFRTIAEHYREQDFALKAIAMYKKIDRLQPRDPEIALNLADLYAEQQLVVDARSYYLIVAEAYKKSGASQQGLEVLRKIANLDPHNTDIRIKLAEGYLKQGMNPEAAATFTEAGQHMLARGLSDEALHAFVSALEICPDDPSVLKGLLAAHIAHGTADEAAEVIESASKKNPDDIALPSLLANAYLAAENAVQSEKATSALIAKQSSEYLKCVDVARLYLKQDQIAEAVRVIENISDRMLAEREDNLLLAVVEEILSCDSDNIQALRLLVRAYWWQRDMEKLRAALERLAEAAQAASLVDDERYALTQLTRLAPDCAANAERLEQLGGALEGAAEELLPQTETAPPTKVHADQFTFEQAAVTPVGESEFEWNSVSATPESVELTDEWVEPAFTFETVVAEELPTGPTESFVEADNSADDKRKDELRRQELESVDFYIAQGYVDIAHDTLNLLEQQFGVHADIEARRQKLNGDMTIEVPVDEAASQNHLDAVTDENLPQTPPLTATQEFVINDSQAAASVAQTIDAGLAEVFEEYRISAETEADAATNGDYETHYNLGLAYKEMDLYEEALEEFQIAAKMVAPADGTGRYLQCCNLLGHCFMQKGVPQAAITWFNKGMNAPDASEDQRQALRYELGSAFEQIGDLRRAMDIFTEVYGINVSYRGVKERLRNLQARLAGDDGSAVPHLISAQNAEQLLN